MDTLTVTAPNRAALDDFDNPRFAGNGQPFFGEDGLSFGDVLDFLNPLQHIPVVGSVYRHLTGDEISTGARLAGGALYGGVAGFAAALVNSVVEEAAGQDIGEHALRLALGGENEAGASAPVAQTASAPGLPAPAPAPQEAQTGSRATETAPDFLAALPDQAQATAARAAFEADRAPTPAASGQVPVLSSAAMQALLGAFDDTDSDDDPTTDEFDAPAMPGAGAMSPEQFAAWQAAATAWSANRP